MEVIPAGFLAAAVNPTDEEIVRWAYIEGAHYPPEMEQDWDLCVVEPRRGDLMVSYPQTRVVLTGISFFRACTS